MIVLLCYSELYMIVLKTTSARMQMRNVRQMNMLVRVFFFFFWINRSLLLSVTHDCFNLLF
jgi:hypothetical protein